MVQALERLPVGRVVGLSVHDPFPGTPEAGVSVRAAVSIDASRVEVDLRDNVDCLPSGLNLSESTACTAAMIGVVEFGPVDEPVDVIFAVDGRINGPIGV
jgi:hypothetical protein